MLNSKYLPHILVMACVVCFGLAFGPPVWAAEPKLDPLGVYAPSDLKSLPGSLVAYENGRPTTLPGFMAKDMSAKEFTLLLQENVDICTRYVELPDIGRAGLSYRYYVDDRILGIYLSPWEQNLPNVRHLDPRDVADRYRLEKNRCEIYLAWVKKNLPWGTDQAPRSMQFDGKIRAGIAVLRDDPLLFRDRVEVEYRSCMNFHLTPMDSRDFDKKPRQWIHGPYEPPWMKPVKQGFVPDGFTGAFYDMRERQCREFMSWAERHYGWPRSV